MHQQRTVPRFAFLPLYLALVFTQSAAHAQGFWSKSYEPAQPFGSMQSNLERFNAIDETVRTGRSRDYGDYLSAGINLSDMACAEWFTMLGRSDRDVSFAKDMMNIVGNVILGVSGINGANPSSLARGSLGLAAGNASIDAFRNEIFLGSLADIDAKLKEGRKITAATIKTTEPKRYDDAKALLMSYHADCSPNAIKILLKTSLASVRYEEADVTLSGAIARAKASDLKGKLTLDLYGAKSTKELSDETLYKLYVAEIAGKDDGGVTWITDIKAEVKSESALFESANVPARTAWLLDYSKIKGFPQQYEATRLAKVEEAKKQKALAEQPTASTTPGGAVMPMRDFRGSSTLKISPSFLEEVFPSGAQSNGAKAAKPKPGTRSSVSKAERDAAAIAAEQKRAADAAAEDRRKADLAAATRTLESVQGAPKAQISESAIGKTGVPVSVNAVLVPIGK